MKTNLSTNSTASFLLGLVFLSVCWSVFSLFKSDSTLPSLQVDYDSDIYDLPDFAAFEDTKAKKQAFFDFLYPIVEKENLFLLNTRQQLVSMKQLIETRALSEDELNWLIELSQEYLLEQNDAQKMLDQLLLNINSVPPSMVLAQAAIESGWGTSRFAKKGNNLFGHWCFESGCGLVPKNRDSNKIHEVAKFKSVNASIRAYLKNLNSFHRYDDFRKLRARTMSNNMDNNDVDVFKLIPGLLAYSELGPGYIKKVNRMIRQNQLQSFDQKFYMQTNKI